MYNVLRSTYRIYIILMIVTAIHFPLFLTYVKNDSLVSSISGVYIILYMTIVPIATVLVSVFSVFKLTRGLYLRHVDRSAFIVNGIACFTAPAFLFIYYFWMIYRGAGI